ncbi:MAG TPA: hypothetical protein PLC90_13560 [Bacteroidales bacterium]|nr:hypothetical protein [Bacteroidales bacterium]
MKFTQKHEDRMVYDGSNTNSHIFLHHELYLKVRELYQKKMRNKK